MASDGPSPPEPPRGSVMSHPWGQHRSPGLLIGAPHSPSLRLCSHHATNPALLLPGAVPRPPVGPSRRGGEAGAGRSGAERGGLGAARNGGGGCGGMGWALLGVGLLLALYTLLRHGLRSAPRPRARPELRGRTAIVTGERPAGRRDGPRCGPGPRSAPRSAPQGEAAASARPRRWSSPAAGPALSWRPAAPGGERPPPAASAG